MEHFEVKVVDKNGNIVKCNEPGELLVRGYNTMVFFFVSFIIIKNLIFKKIV